MENKNKPNKKRHTASILQGLSFLTQLGVSIIAPLLFCIFLAVMAQKYLNAGDWVFILAFFFGLGGMVSSFLTFARHVRKKAEKNEDEPPTSFNK